VKRYSDLTKEELVALGDDKARVQTFIDIEIAFAGIIPVTQPEAPRLVKPDIEPTVEAFEVYGLIFRDEKEALGLAKMNVSRANYDYTLGTEYHYIESAAERYDAKGVNPKAYYSKHDLDSVRQQLIDIKSEKETYEKGMKAYTDYTKKISTIRDDVWDAIREALDEKRELDQALNVFARHKELAENDEAIAKNFFREAYKNDPEMIEKVLGEKPAEAPAPAAPAPAKEELPI